MSYWKDKVVVVTGGSAGLGLAFVNELIERGASVAMVARDETKLVAAAQATGCPERTQCLVADITQAADVAALPSQVADRFGRVDALINCAGKSSRGELLTTSPEEFQQLWELNFLATVRCTQAFASGLVAANGHVVNIGSLASKVASKFLGAYPTSKHPLAAFSQQLRLEALGRFHVLLVCPGPIARADAGMRYEGTDVPEQAKQPGGGAKIKGLDPHRIVNETLRACERRQLELIIPGKARFLFLVSAISPSWGDWLLRKFTSS